MRNAAMAALRPLSIALALVLLPPLALVPLVACAGRGPDTRSPSPVVAADAACPAAWLGAPAVDPSIAVPEGGRVVVHASATGTQDYACEAVADGGTHWNLVGPQASLSDCNGSVFGQHFASDAGSRAPQWQSTDGAYVVGQKVAAFTPDGGAGSIPWLLVRGVGRGGAGALSQAAYIQRVHTDGGVAPPGSCSPGATDRVPYAADYYFYGP